LAYIYAIAICSTHIIIVGDVTWFGMRRHSYRTLAPDGLPIYASSSPCEKTENVTALSTRRYVHFVEMQTGADFLSLTLNPNANFKPKT